MGGGGEGEERAEVGGGGEGEERAEGGGGEEGAERRGRRGKWRREQGPQQHSF